MNIYDFDITHEEMNNKLFCTFIDKEGLNDLLKEIQSKYTVLYNKIFVLYSPDSDEYICTYNIDTTLSKDILFNNTILVHRKKESNTLYTINALNELIKTLNNGVLDTKYNIIWPNYSNRILLTKNNELKHINTNIYKIINL
jgi:hypothetical protein